MQARDQPEAPVYNSAVEAVLAFARGVVDRGDGLDLMRLLERCSREAAREAPTAVSSAAVAKDDVPAEPDKRVDPSQPVARAGSARVERESVTTGAARQLLGRHNQRRGRQRQSQLWTASPTSKPKDAATAPRLPSRTKYDAKVAAWANSVTSAAHNRAMSKGKSAGRATSSLHAAGSVVDSPAAEAPEACTADFTVPKAQEVRTVDAGTRGSSDVLGDAARGAEDCGRVPVDLGDEVELLWGAIDCQTAKAAVQAEERVRREAEWATSRRYKADQRHPSDESLLQPHELKVDKLIDECVKKAPAHAVALRDSYHRYAAGELTLDALQLELRDAMGPDALFEALWRMVPVELRRHAKAQGLSKESIVHVLSTKLMLI
jgi:hypothetical protein